MISTMFFGPWEKGMVGLTLHPETIYLELVRKGLKCILNLFLKSVSNQDQTVIVP